MSLITKPSELKGNNVIKGLIYGVPGAGKTTLALSAPTPILLDFDRGLHRVSIQHRKDSLQVETYQQALEVINSPELANYKTIVIDTLGKLIDKLGDHVALANPKLKAGNGQLSMQGWGAVKQEFQALLKLLESKGKSCIFVAHESEEKDGDINKKRPDCAGSARKDIIKELDFMGYMSISGKKRVLDLSPSEFFYAKNSLGISDFLEIPFSKTSNDFLTKNIFEATKKMQIEQAELFEKYNSVIGIIESRIEEIATVEDLNAYYKDGYQKVENILSSHLIEKERLAEKAGELNTTFDKETKTFKIKEEK